MKGKRYKVKVKVKVNVNVNVKVKAKVKVKEKVTLSPSTKAHKRRRGAALLFTSTSALDGVGGWVGKATPRLIPPPPGKAL